MVDPRPIAEVDPEVAAILDRDARRQNGKIQLIASENFASRAVLEAQGSILQNKYAEGYPGRRYYEGCEHVDEVERLAIERAKALFGAEHANVQPLSGAQANMAVYFALLQPGDTVLGMELAHGGHLTHGSPVNSSGILYNFVPYGVSEGDERIDMEVVARLAHEHRPKIILGGATAYPRHYDFEAFRKIADDVDAIFVFDAAHVIGLIAGGAHPDPVPYADVVTATTHKALRGPRSGVILCQQRYAAAIDKNVFPGVQGGPHMHTVAAKAVAFGEAATPAFGDYSHQIVRNAAALAAGLQREGFRLVSGGTDNHLMLVDLRAFDADLTGKTAATLLDSVGITLNRNTIPFDPRSPFVTSGLRIGTPAVTSTGMRDEQMEQIAALISAALRAREDEAALDRVRAHVVSLTDRFHPY